MSLGIETMFGFESKLGLAFAALRIAISSRAKLYGRMIIFSLFASINSCCVVFIFYSLWFSGYRVRSSMNILKYIYYRFGHLNNY